MAVIKLKDAKRIIRLEAEIFVEEDQDIEYVNRKVTAPKYRAICAILERITPDDEEQKKIWNTISSNKYGTYQELADALAAIGHTVEE